MAWYRALCGGAAEFCGVHYRFRQYQYMTAWRYREVKSPEMGKSEKRKRTF